MSDIFHINTRLGKIAVERHDGGGDAPLVLLHGVYFDRHLWDHQAASISDRVVYALDMPHHGESSDTPRTWDLADCADMLLEVLERLQLGRVVAVGHSWGSMTILRAAVRRPEPFAAVGFCNMPLDEGAARKKPGYLLLSTMLPFRGFYTRQAAKTLFAAESLRSHPEFVESLRSTFDRLSDREVRQVDLAVRIGPDDGYGLVKRLQVPALALRGLEDYVPDPPGLELTLVSGGHVSPLEAPDAVLDFIRRVIGLGDARG